MPSYKQKKTETPTGDSPLESTEGPSAEAKKKDRTTDPQAISLGQLFLTFLKINSFTFGGGYTIVPVIRDEFVQNKHCIQEDEMLDIVAIAQSGPGPMAINASILTGYRILGPKGALVSLAASVLPCLVIISLLFYIYKQVASNPWVMSAFACMGGMISAVMLVTCFRMAKEALKQHKRFSALLMALAFILGYWGQVNTALIILGAGLAGLAVFSLCKDESGDSQDWTDRGGNDKNGSGKAWTDRGGNDENGSGKDWTGKGENADKEAR